MAESYTYDGGALLTVRDNTTELTLTAELGGVGSGRLTIDDSDGDEEIVGQKDFAHEESACSISLTFSGFVAERTYHRGATMNATARDIDVSLVDLNAMLGFRLIHQQAGMTVAEGGNRPRETIAARGAWLLASPFVDGLFTDEGRCSFSSAIEMTKSDYRNQYPGDVLADMALAQGFGTNYHVNDYGDGPELTFRNDHSSTADSSSLRISNVMTDQDGSTFYPFKDASLTRTPADVYSKIAFSNAKTTVYEERAATATAFNGERGGQASNSNVNTSAAARLAAQDLLWQHHTEEDSIECTVQATDAQVNLMPPGWRIQAKFSHLATEGYGSFTWFRILEVTKTPIVADGSWYDVKLKLSPQEAAEPVAAIVQSAFDRGGLTGVTLTLPNPVTIGNVLVVMTSSRVDYDPEPPNVSAVLPRWGAGLWTRFNGANLTTTEGSSTGNGISAYYKVADSTEQTGLIQEQNSVAGIWELSGADPASAVIQWVDQELGGTDYDIGTAGVVATGEVAVAGWCLGTRPSGWPWTYGNDYAWQTPNPLPGIDTGWNIRISKWSYDHYSLQAYLPAEPWSVLADHTGTGATLDGAIQPGHSGNTFGGLVIVIPPV